MWKQTKEKSNGMLSNCQLQLTKLCRKILHLQISSTMETKGKLPASITCEAKRNDELNELAKIKILQTYTRAL